MRQLLMYSKSLESKDSIARNLVLKELIFDSNICIWWEKVWASVNIHLTFTSIGKVTLEMNRLQITSYPFWNIISSVTFSIT